MTAQHLPSGWRSARRPGAPGGPLRVRWERVAILLAALGFVAAFWAAAGLLVLRLLGG